MSATNKSRLTLAEVGSTGYTYKKMKPERPSTLPPEDRPREKLYRWGCEQLSDAELLTISNAVPPNWHWNYSALQSIAWPN
jgi:hypothetical protein